MIVDSHVRLIKLDRSFLFDLFRFALYFFHCAFGYYYMKGLHRNRKKVPVKNLKRLIVPVLFWIVIYTLLNIYNEVLSGNMSMMDFLKHQCIALFISGTGFHLWFMASLMIYVVLAGFLYQNGQLKKLYPASIVLYLIGLLGSYYDFIGNRIPLLSAFFSSYYFTTWCRLFLHGLPMFTMGLYIAQNDQKLMQIDHGMLCISCAVLAALSFAEIYLVVRYAGNRTNICSLFLCLFTFPFFILLLKNPLQEQSGIARALKYISTFMYYSHPLFRTVLASAFMRLFGFDLSDLLMSIVVVILCTVFGYALYRLNNRYLNKICS